mgnify:FL=1
MKLISNKIVNIKGSHDGYLANDLIGVFDLLLGLSDRLITMNIFIFSQQAMFKNYDDDKDGYISIEEFETISSNFPFIESFCVLDANE